MAVSCVKVSGAGLIPTPIRRLLHHRLVAWISRQLTAEHPHHFLSRALAQIQISDKGLPIERPTKIELVIQSCFSGSKNVWTPITATSSSSKGPPELPG
jgi:hypothetical protein